MSNRSKRFSPCLSGLGSTSALLVVLLHPFAGRFGGVFGFDTDFDVVDHPIVRKGHYVVITHSFPFDGNHKAIASSLKRLSLVVELCSISVHPAGGLTCWFIGCLPVLYRAVPGLWRRSRRGDCTPNQRGYCGLWLMFIVGCFAPSV